MTTDAAGVISPQSWARMQRLVARVQEVLPSGEELSEQAWGMRHRVIVILLFVHGVGLAAFGTVRGFGLYHSILEGTIPLLCGIVASAPRLSRTVRSVVATFGLLTASALLVHFSGGVIETHFHFFVMVAVVSLYQAWTPFLLAIAYVVLQHGTIGVIYPDAVYNHAAAIARPWRWAGIHGLFIAGESLACLAYWRLSEDASTARRKAESEMRQSEARFRSSFRNTLSGMLMTELTGGIIEVNGAFCRMLGYDEDELRGMNWRDVTHPEDMQDSERAVEDVVSGREPAGHITKRYVRKDGETVWAESAFSPVRDPNGEPLYFVTQVQDVSEKKRAEQEKEVLESQLRQSQKMDAVGRLAGGVAHDFNNLLAVIMNFAGFVKDELESDDPRREDIEEIRKAADKGARLVKQLLAFSRKDVAQPEVIDLSEVVSEMQKLLARTIGEDVQLDLNQERDLWPVVIDSGQIEQVLMNLAVNARDAMPQGGSLMIQTANVVADESTLQQHPGMAAGEYVTLVVHDSGLGMAEDIQAHIFEPFFTTKPRGEGSGLGLATVYGIVRQAGGYISVYSEPSHGSAFRIYLPAAKERVLDVDPSAASVSRRGRGETILVAEDEDSVRRLVTRMLTDAGYKVLPASCGDEALKVFEIHSGPIDLVLTDVIMPKMSGKELIDVIREAQPEVKALYMSGYTDEIIAQQGLLGPGVEFIQKPFEKEELLDKVVQILAGRASGADTAKSARRTVLIVDDEAPMTHLLRLMLERDFDVVGEAATGDEALELARTKHPELVVLDYRLPGLQGDEVAPLLRGAAPGAKIIAFSAILKERPIWADGFLGKEQIAALSSELERVARAA